MQNQFFLSGSLVLLLILTAVGCPSPGGTDKPKQPATDGGGTTEDVPGQQPEAEATQPAPESGEGDTADHPQQQENSPEQEPVDEFVAKNGAIFKDWPDPQAAILISGEQIGYLEPCGCAGLENQKGGLKRRHTLIRTLTQKGWPVAPLDLGGQIRRYGPQAEIKFSTALESLVTLGYQTVALGPQDLTQPAEQLISVAANLGDEKNPFVTANVGLFELPSEFIAPMRVLEIGGKKVGVTAVLGKEYQATVNNDDIKLAPAEEALEKIVPELREKSDYLVLLSHATPAESKQLAAKFPDFNVVVTAGGADEPALEPIKLNDGKTLLVEVGHKGMYVVVLGLYDQGPTVRYQRVPLDGRFADSPEMNQSMAKYQKILETLGMQGLGVRAHEHPTGRKFVGSESCAACHSEATEVWENTTHSHATKTLVDLNPARHFDPECLSCHVTGWDPQKFYPYVSGYTELKATEHLRTNGCENCHGPGSQHVAAESGDIEADEKQLEEFRKQMQLKFVEGELEEKVVGPVFKKCVECHDHDNSPDFHEKGKFKEYWDKVKHVGKE